MTLCVNILEGGVSLSLPSKPLYHLLCLAPAHQPAEEPSGPFPSCPLLPGQVSVGKGGPTGHWGYQPHPWPPQAANMGRLGGAAEASRFLAEENSGSPDGEHCSLLLGPPLSACLIIFSSCLHSFRPALPVSYLQAELAFEGEAACRAFLEPLGLSYTGPDNSSVDCRLSLAQLPAF